MEALLSKESVVFGTAGGNRRGQISGTEGKESGPRQAVARTGRGLSRGKAGHDRGREQVVGHRFNHPGQVNAYWR